MDLCIFVIKKKLSVMKVDFLDVKRVNDSFQPELSKTVDRVVRSGWYLLGGETESFESDFASYIGTDYCIGVGNGLDALTIVLSAWKRIYKWDDDDKIIVPANTFIATVLAVSKAGLKPVFCDVSDDDALIDVNLLEKCISERTRAIVPVHLYGQVCNMDAINLIAERNGLKVLEDACQAHGAIYSGSTLNSPYNEVHAGCLGHAAAFSFYPGKNLGALGDGGCVVTNELLLAEYVRSYANYGQSCKYLHEYKGVNSRLDELQAAVLRLKLKRLDSDNAKRSSIADKYYSKLSNPQISLFKRPSHDTSHVYHLFVIRCKDRDRLQRYLNKKGISTLIHYPCCPHKQKAYAEYASCSYPVAEMLQNQVLSIPISPVMTKEEVDYVVAMINDFC